MGIQLFTAPQFDKRFEFVFFIDQNADRTRVYGRAEIFELSNRVAVLEMIEARMSRLEVADALLARCVRWTATRVEQSLADVPAPMAMPAPSLQASKRRRLQS